MTNNKRWIPTTGKTYRRMLHLRVSRTESWYPIVDVPAHLDDEQALEWAMEHCSDEIYDEYLHKYTYDSDTMTQIVPQTEVVSSSPTMSTTSATTRSQH